MTPEPYPTPWRWVDLGLPSRTLWLDRNVGANSPTDAGLYFMWGQKFGHRADSGYSFNSEAYIREGLDLINADLTAANDGASLYYGSQYRMPTTAQINELIQATTIVNGEGYIELMSNVNGNSIRIPNCGYIEDLTIHGPDSRRFSSRTYRNAQYQNQYRQDVGFPQGSIEPLLRERAIPIRPVKSS